ncbi:fatty acid/sphingolipid desaturase, partial [Rhodotorula sp. JG-1b]
LPTLSRREVACRITRGELLVLHPPLVYRVPRAWLDLHPGGPHAILHYVGRDASCEIEAYHTARTVQERMARWVVAKVDVDDSDLGEGWRDMTPPIQLGKWPVPIPTITAPTTTIAATAAAPDVLTIDMVDPPLRPEDYEHLPLTPAYQAHLRRSVKRLYAGIQSKGLDTPPRFLAGYGPSLVIYTTLALFSIWCYRRAVVSHSTFDYILAAVCLGAFYHQVTFVVHDAGHTALTGSWLIDRLWGIALGDFLGGLSVGWWADNHNVHHLVTNAPEHDPDIQHLPFFAISTRFFESVRSTYYNRLVAFDGFAKFFLPHQHKLYYLIMCFARFNLFALAYTFLLTRWPGRRSPLFKLRILELVGIAFFWAWFGGIVLRGIDTAAHRWLYVIVTFAVTSPLHVQLSIPRGSLELLESHPHRQLRTTMDISCPTYLDFLHGGLNFQTPHHFFPRIPRFRFRAVAKEIEQWLKEGEGIRYKKMTFVEGNRSVLGVLRDVAQQVELLAKVAEKDAKGELHH